VIKLRRLGKILHASKSRSLIAKLEKPNPPKLGSKIFDEKLKEVGIVTDVFGPTSSPYISIKPLTNKLEIYVGKVVYSLKD
jgi:rRNA processing protein Gar1